MVLIGVINFVYLYMLIHMKPYRARKRNAIRIFSEMTFFVGILTLNAYIIGKEQFSLKHLKILGWVTTISFLSQLVIELIG